jgi:ankyrin repeat protein
MKKTLVSVILMVLAWAAAFTGPAGAAMTDGDFIALCERGTPQEIEAAIRGGANVNAKDSGGLTALILAAEYNSDPEVVRALLQAGADVNAKNPGSVTALMAAGENNPEVVRALLWGGADVNAQSVTGTTALMIAALKNNDPAVINALLEGGADAELRDAYGKTAADYAQSNEALAGSDVLRRLRDFK